MTTQGLLCILSLRHTSYALGLLDILCTAAKTYVSRLIDHSRVDFVYATQ